MVLESLLSPIQSAVSPGSDSYPILELFERINMLTTQFHEERVRSKQLHQMIEKLLLRLPPAEEHQGSPTSSSVDRSCSLDFCKQVFPSHADTKQGDFNPGFRDNLLKNSEMSVFDGERIYGWLSLVKRYFWIGGFNDMEKLDLVSVHLAGDALGWYNLETGSMVEYVWLFEDISAQVSGLDDHKLEGIFLNGLRP
ncbi:PREDICTED: uncharacterized protein LOC104747885 isoform X2 [Camelina sativa]|uniref:Uncharacterized protein LOC104747885 isoform X2 n=1 Tax=Camelina sativa TaxID=90675 RepID=A0ABM0WA47_CAMSA|nr:PREDICTED: uncharacterized protein LOC104747885 isoform X2 [Camelina sativa]